MLIAKLEYLTNLKAIMELGAFELTAEHITLSPITKNLQSPSPNPQKYQYSQR